MYSPRAIPLALVLAATTTTTTTGAAVGPLYQTPSSVSSYADPFSTDTPSKQCQASTFGVVGGGDILVSDCQAILDDLDGGDSFTLWLSFWRDSTALEDHFWVYVTSGSCQFALKRVDGLNNTVYIGDGDLKEIINQSINLGNGTCVQTVEGTIPCISQTDAHDPYARIEWSLRQTGNVN